MRRFLIPLLMAGTMMPAAAMAQDSDREGNREERRAERRVERAESNTVATEAESRPQRIERVERVERPQRVERVERVERVADEPRIERRERRFNRVQEIEQASQVEPVRTVQDEPVRVRRQDGILGAIRETARQQEVLESRPATRDERHDGVRDGRYDRNQRWSGQWRGDNRYDWRRHRDRHRSIFRIGRYYDPYGWGYRRFSIGFSIGSGYYGSNYWLDDPWAYRLPPAYGPYRWVRYYDDALLVNIYSGQVVDVIHNFFW